MTQQELYDFILANRMAYTRMLKSTHPVLYTEITTKYAGVKNTGESFWLYCNNYTDTLKCECGAKLLFENVVSGYKSKECKVCYEKNRKANSAAEAIKRTQSDIAPQCENILCTNPTILKKNGIWSSYCSLSCRGKFNSLKSRDKSKSTMLSNHGVEHALQNKDILEKMKLSLLQTYGHDNVMGNTSVSHKHTATKIAKYGYASAWCNPASYRHHVDVAAEKYGYAAGKFSNISQIPEIHKKKMKSGFLAKDYTLPSGNTIRIQGYENKFLDIALTYYSESDFEFSIAAIQYQYNNKIHHYFPDFVIVGNQVIEVKSDYTFFADLDKNIAKALGVVLSGSELTFAIYREKGCSSYLTFSEQREMIRSVLDDNNIKYTHIQQFGDYIVDFMLQDNNIAVCYRSSTFTNEIFSTPTYYYDMFIYFEKLGIQLITVNDVDLTDTWMASLVRKCTKPTDRVFARNTEIREVSKESFKFLNTNHIQGFAATSIKYGLYYENELVALMCFNKFRQGIGKDRGEKSYELVRYATSVNVIGGASKLLAYFVKTHNPEIVYSYSDNSISNGGMYEKLQFTLESTNKSDYKYKYLNEHKLHHRFGFRKGALKDKLAFFDETMSERTLMKLNKFTRMYDSGKRTWVKQYTK